MFSFYLRCLAAIAVLLLLSACAGGKSGGKKNFGIDLAAAGIISTEIEVSSRNFVFGFDLSEDGTLTAFTSGNSNTVGYLHDLTIPPAVQIAEDDDSGSGMNFQIIEAVFEGIYEIEVTSARTPDEPYTLSLSFDAAEPE